MPDAVIDQRVQHGIYLDPTLSVAQTTREFVASGTFDVNVRFVKATATWTLRGSPADRNATSVTATVSAGSDAGGGDAWEYLSKPTAVGIGRGAAGMFQSGPIGGVSRGRVELANSRRSHTLAEVQSLLTVRVETDRIEAISLLLRPRKKRICTT